MYAVKAQTSLAPLSRFRGSRVTTAHAHQCCIFQSYAKTVLSRMKLTIKLTMREPTFMGSMTTDTWSRHVTSNFNSVFGTSMQYTKCPWKFIIWIQGLQLLGFEIIIKFWYVSYMKEHKYGRAYRKICTCKCKRSPPLKKILAIQLGSCVQVSNDNFSPSPDLCSGIRVDFQWIVQLRICSNLGGIEKVFKFKYSKPCLSQIIT